MRVLWFAGIALAVLLPFQAAYSRTPEHEDTHMMKQTGFTSYGTFRDSLLTIVEMERGAERDSLLERFWEGLLAAGQVPFIEGDSVAFLYKGNAGRVDWLGDWNRWGKECGPDSVLSKGVKLSDTQIWMLETTFPRDARLDYKIVLNGSQWLLDPRNPRFQWGGFGPNSVLRMPEYVPPPEVERDRSIASGFLGEEITIASARLGYDVNYRLYTPAGHDTLENMPVVYVTDGHEYAKDEMGSMVVVLDNLIAANRIEPVVAVFVDPRDPWNPADNRRRSEYVGNGAFADFLCDELVPAVDGMLRTRASADGRLLLGTSLGGLNSAFVGARRPDIFGNIAIQSPALYVWPEIYDLLRERDLSSLRVFLSNGRVGDGQDAPKLAAILEEKGCEYRFVEVNEGHSWGQWRALLDDLLVCFFAKEE